MGRVKRLDVKGSTLAGHLSVTCWAQRRRLSSRCSGNQCGGHGVVFNTQERRSGRVALLWAEVCGKVKNQTSFLEPGLMLCNLRMAQRSSKSPFSSPSQTVRRGVNELFDKCAV